MKREYTLNGLHCANCADKIEKRVQKLDGVTFASVSIATSTLVLAAENDGIMEQVRQIVHSLEPDVIVTEKVKNQYIRGGGNTSQNIRLAVGAVCLAAALALDLWTDAVIPASVLFLAAYVVTGAPIVWKAIKGVVKGQLFDETFLMTIASLGALLLGELPEAAAVMLFFCAGEYLNDLAVDRSRRSIAALTGILPDSANLRTANGVITVKPEAVNPGDVILVKPGERAPLDGVVLEGEGFADTSALTGESVPRRVGPGDEVLAGYIIQNGLLTVSVTKPYGQSTAARIMELVESAASRKSPSESFITKFSRVYTPVVVALAALTILIPSLFFGGDWGVWASRGLVFLVVSCPCALVISVPLGFFAGIGAASKQGILIKGGNYLEALNTVDTAVFDKTGTLTKGVFQVTSIEAAPGFNDETILKLAAVAEANSVHPIARSVLEAYGKTPDTGGLTSHTETAGLGITALYNGRRVLAGSARLLESEGVPYTESAKTGTKVYVADNGVFAGCLTISDKVRDGAAEALRELKNLGIKKTVMLTGDNSAVAADVARELSVDQVYAELLPHEKVEKLEALAAAGGNTLFVGDGINDAPALAMAKVGAAVWRPGGDAAMEAADVVFMAGDPGKFPAAVRIARATRRTVTQNIVFAIAVKVLILSLAAMGYASMWAAVFADVGVTMLAVLNATTVLKAK